VSLLLIALGVTLCVGLWRAARARRRRQARQSMFVTTYPLLELTEPYGGWNADAYDHGTGHGPPPSRSTWHSGPPSTWGRLP
jgi:hypothetical protein